MTARSLPRVFLSILLGCLVVEVGWRVYLGRFASWRHVGKWTPMNEMPERALKYRPHPYIGYALNPSFVSDDGKNRHNSLGFRGEEFPREKPPGEFRMAFLGGSTTYDSDIPDYRDSFAFQLEKILREEKGHDVRVVNAGVSGYTSFESLVNLQLRVLDVDPDLVVIYHATNDVFARIVPSEVYARDNSGHRKPWVEELHWWDLSRFLHYVGVQAGFSVPNSLEARTHRLYEGLDPHEALARNPPKYFKENLENMAALSKHHEVDILLASWAGCPSKEKTVAFHQPAVLEHNAISAQVASEQGVPYYDFAAEMPEDPQYWSDGRHNNERGARLKAELFAAYLEKNYLVR